MRLLLIDPNHPFDVYGTTVFSGPVHPSLTMATLAGAARDSGHEVRVLDLRWGGDPSAALTETLREYEADIIGLSVYTLTFSTARKLAAEARQAAPGAFLVAGGVFPTVDPETILKSSAFDAVVMGEGEETLCELLSGKDPAAVAGLMIRSGDGFQRTMARGLVASLDTLSIPGWDLFPVERYAMKQPLWKSRLIASAETSRGCPYNCSYCTSRSVFGNRWRAKSAGRVMEEIERLDSMGFGEVHFQDDGFTTDLERAKEICRAMLRRGKTIHWELTNGIRLDRVDDEFLGLAARAGCYRIFFGVEAGDAAVLDDVGKKIDPRAAIEVVRTAKKHGIEALAFFMIALPGDTKETLEETIRLANRVRPNYMRASIFIPFPGSAVFKKWKEEGRIISEDWGHYHFHEIEHLPYRHPNLTNEEIASAYRRFYRRFYFNPRYLAERVVWGLRKGTLWRDLSYFVAKFLPATFRFRRHGKILAEARR